MTIKDKKLQAVIKKAQAQEDRRYTQRVNRIKRAVAAADFLDQELIAIEAIVFGAYGRTKLR